ncbi:MAG TPA: single-stranded-DNA-specific exonuclease RecJ [Kofleriaceae bacterium]|nr:single-stranded-DNA-specific exonuclease RecJ [Kofleriaceae bacterium]
MAWKIAERDPAEVARLARALGVREVTARCLANRGFGSEAAARSFLEPRLGELRPPAGLAGMDAAVGRLALAVARGERVGCFGDYDVDGVTTAALLSAWLRGLGVPVSTRVARRDAGYGFGAGDLDWFAGRGCTLIVTGDCGTSDQATIAAAAVRGIEVIVVDHHTVPAAGQAHPAVALVNPLRADSSFPFRGLASVGLAFYLAAALRTRLRADGTWARAAAAGGRGGAEPDLRDLLDLVAVGTLADLVPLRGENRILTAVGLGRLAARQRPGLAALLGACGVQPGDPIDERTVAWKLAPRLNAPGRLGDAEPALALLLADDPASASSWAERLEQANQERRVAQDRVMSEALAAAESGSATALATEHAIVVWSRGWASGVVGIAAARLADRYRKPAFVIAIDDGGVGRGSARNAGRVDLYRVLDRCAPLLVRYGGHAAAAGLTVDEARMPAIAEAIAAAAAAESRADTAAAEADAQVALGDVDLRLAEELGALAPFGKENEPPLLVARGLHVVDSRRVGDGSHLKLELADGRGDRRSAIGFGLGDQDPGPGAQVSVSFSPTASTWKGQRRVELELRALARADEPG